MHVLTRVTSLRSVYLLGISRKTVFTIVHTTGHAPVAVGAERDVALAKMAACQVVHMLTT
jgi:hypothetical protein